MTLRNRARAHAAAWMMFGASAAAAAEPSDSPRMVDAIWPAEPRIVQAKEEAPPASALADFLAHLRPTGWFETPPATPAHPFEQPTDQKVRSRWSIRGDVGNGVGYRNGFTYVEGFIPVWQPSADSVAFADVRVVNFFHDDRWEYNFGGGYRKAIGDSGVVGGVNSFFDLRQYDGRSFHQIGAGLELLSDRFEWRGNGYFIVGPSSKDTGGPLITTTQSGIDTVITSTRRSVTAMDGFDTEVGAPVPLLEQFYTRAYVGGYYYTGHGAESLTGFRTRLESQIHEHASLHFAFQTDRVFGETISGGVLISFGAPAYRSGRCGPSLTDILGQRIVRDIDIVLQEGSQTGVTVIPGVVPPPPTPPAPPLPPPPPPPPPPPDEEEEEESEQELPG